MLTKIAENTKRGLNFALSTLEAFFRGVGGGGQVVVVVLWDSPGAPGDFCISDYQRILLGALDLVGLEVVDS